MIYLLAFTGGLAGSIHCLGMCGGLVAILASASGPRAWARVWIYNLARVNALVVIGAAAGALGTAVIGWGPIDVAERTLAIVAGLVTVVVGLEVVGLLAPRGLRIARWIQHGLGRGVRGLLAAPSPWAPVALGSLNALLPCQLIYAFAAMAAGTGSIGRGALTMLAFGLGTVPAMVAPGAVRSLVRTGSAGWIVRTSGGLVVVVGLVTVARGLAPSLLGHAHLHLHQ